MVTGAGRGIGRAIATALARRGARLTLLGRRPPALEQTAAVLRAVGGAAATVAGDVRDIDARQRAIGTAVAEFGGLDILVNNAGNISGGRLESTSEADIRAMIEVDLLAPILLTRAALAALRRSAGATIVNVSSGFGLVPAPFYATYSAAKAGLAQFSEALRRELLGSSIHVMTVYPAVTDTPMMASSRVVQELGLFSETSEDVAQAVIAGLEAGEREVIRGGAGRLSQIATQRTRPWEIDEYFRAIMAKLEAAVSKHRSF
jgi:short-subunit dehydrogenase